MLLERKYHFLCNPLFYLGKASLGKERSEYSTPCCSRKGSTMSTTSIQQSKQQAVSRQEQQAAPTYGEEMTWRSRWFLIRAIPLLYAASLLSGLVGCWITKDPRYLSLASPTLFVLPTIRYLVPMDERRYQLELRKIEVKAQKRERQQKNKQISS